MSGWQILGLVLILFFLMGQIKVGVGAEFAQDGLTVRARLGWIKIKVFPLSKKEGKKQKKTKKKKSGKKNDGSAQKASKPVGEKVGGALDLAKQFLPLALEAAGCFWRKLVMDELELYLTIGGPDPADAAMLYGRANATLAALWEPITNAFHVKDGHAQVRVDFDAPGMTLYGKASLSLKIGQILWLAIYFGGKALVRFFNYRSIRKAKQKERKAV